MFNIYQSCFDKDKLLFCRENLIVDNLCCFRGEINVFYCQPRLLKTFFGEFRA